MLKRGSERETLGKVVLGTPRRYPRHRQNLVATILSASGFQIFDLGTSVNARAIRRQAREIDADIVGVSALLTTTMAGQKSRDRSPGPQWYAATPLKSDYRRRRYHPEMGG